MKKEIKDLLCYAITAHPNDKLLQLKIEKIKRLIKNKEDGQTDY